MPASGFVGRCLVIAIALVVSAGVPAASAGAAHETCATTGTTVAADSVARAYESFPANPDFVDLMACLYGRSPLQIASASMFDLPAFKVGFSGPYVAVATDTDLTGLLQATLQVFDLGTRRMILQPRPATSAASGPSVSVTALVLSGRTIAWIVSTSAFSLSAVSRPIYEVHRADGRGNTLLDRGVNIAAKSLALSSNGRRIYWLDGHSVRTATL